MTETRLQKKYFCRHEKSSKELITLFLMLGVTHVIAREKEIQKFTRA